MSNYTGFDPRDITAADYYFVVMGDGTCIIDTANYQSAEDVAIHFASVKGMNAYVVDAFQIRFEVTAGHDGIDHTDFIDENGSVWRDRETLTAIPSRTTAERAAKRDAMWNSIG